MHEAAVLIFIFHKITECTTNFLVAQIVTFSNNIVLDFGTMQSANTSQILSTLIFTGHCLHY